jgi:uncharacterized membrane protein YfcA
MYAIYEQADEQARELIVVCLFSVLGLVLSAAVISMTPADAMSWVITHLEWTPGH